MGNELSYSSEENDNDDAQTKGQEGNWLEADNTISESNLAPHPFDRSDTDEVWGVSQNWNPLEYPDNSTPVKGYHPLERGKCIYCGEKIFLYGDNAYKANGEWLPGAVGVKVGNCPHSHLPVIMNSLDPVSMFINDHTSPMSPPQCDHNDIQRDSEHCVQDEQHTASTGSSEEASDKDTTLPQFVRTDLDEFLDAYETFIRHKQNSEEGWGVSAKLTNVLDHISLTEGDKCDPLRIQLNSEGYREIEKHIKSVLTTANGMEIKVNKWLKEYQSGDIEMSEMIRALEVQVWMRMKVWEDEKELGWKYLECILSMQTPEGKIEYEKFLDDLKSLLRLGFRLMPETTFCNWLMETLTVGFKISLHDDYGPNLLHELLEELKLLPQEPYSIHRFLIPAYDVLGMHIQLQKKTNTCLVSTVLPDSVAYYHGVEEKDEILSPVGDEIGESTNKYNLFLRAAKSKSIAFVVKRHIKTVETTKTNHLVKMQRPHRFVITEPGSLGLTLSVGNEQDRDAEKHTLSTVAPISLSDRHEFFPPIMVSSVASGSLSDIHGIQKGDIFCLPGTGGAHPIATRPFLKLINSDKRPLTLEVLRWIVPKSVESSISEEAYMKAMQEKQGMGENPFNFNPLRSCETEAKVAEGVHEEDTLSSDGDDDDGKSTCESETEVVEGVENQRGALHSLSDPPANLSSKKSNGKCRRPPKKKNGNSKNRGKSRSDHVLVNDKKANKKEHGSRVIINHSLPVLHGVPNDRTCILDSLCAHIGDPSVKQALVSSFYQMMPKHGDTSIQLANKILDEHGMILKRATPEYQGDQDGCMDFKLLMQRKCRLIVSVSLYDLKEPDRYAPHCVAWDGELIHDRPNSVRVNNTSDRTPAKSRAVFNRLFHKKIYSRWEFGDIYELVDSPGGNTHVRATSYSIPPTPCW